MFNVHPTKVKSPGIHASSPSPIEAPSLARLYFRALSCSHETSLIQRIAAWAVTILTGIIPALFIGGLAIAWENITHISPNASGVHLKSHNIAKSHLQSSGKHLAGQHPAIHFNYAVPQDPTQAAKEGKPLHLSIDKAVEQLQSDHMVLSTKAKFPKIWEVLIDGSAPYLHINKRYMLLKSLKSYAANVAQTLQPANKSKLAAVERGYFRCFSSTSPVYVNSCYQPKYVHVYTHTGYFSYHLDPSGLPVVITDFSNKCFGGAVLNRGFVQEEKMLFEFPELLEYLLASGITAQLRCLLQTRRPLDDGPDQDGAEVPGNGHPDPVLFEGVSRSLSVDGKIYYETGRTLDINKQMIQTGFKDATDEELQKYVVEASSPVDKVNILAITAPKIAKKSLEEQFSYTTMLDLVNTSLAGVLLMNKKFSGGYVWRTGRFGCGAFNNHPLAAYLAQRLAAEQMGVTKLEFYGYNEDATKQCEQAWTVFTQLTEKALQVGHKLTVNECSQMLVQSAKQVLANA